jgi:hypothetical protein
MVRDRRKNRTGGGAMERWGNDKWGYEPLLVGHKKVVEDRVRKAMEKSKKVAPKPAVDGLEDPHNYEKASLPKSIL